MSTPSSLPSLEILPIDLAAQLKTYGTSTAKSKARKLRVLVLMFEQWSEGCTDKTALVAAGISRTTFRNWQRKDASFNRLVNAVRQSAADAMMAEVISMGEQASAALGLAHSRLQQAAPAAVDTLADVAQSSVAKDADRIKAAAQLLNRAETLTGAVKPNDMDWSILIGLLKNTVNLEDAADMLDAIFYALLKFGVKTSIIDGRLTLDAFHTTDPQLLEQIQASHAEASADFEMLSEKVVDMPIDVPEAKVVKLTK